MVEALSTREMCEKCRLRGRRGFMKLVYIDQEESHGVYLHDCGYHRQYYSPRNVWVGVGQGWRPEAYAKAVADGLIEDDPDYVVVVDKVYRRWQCGVVELPEDAYGF